MPCPLFTKARTIGDEYALVLPINYDRHFGPAFNQLKDGLIDFPFLDKISKVKTNQKINGKGSLSSCESRKRGMHVDSISTEY